MTNKATLDSILSSAKLQLELENQIGRYPISNKLQINDDKQREPKESMLIMSDFFEAGKSTIPQIYTGAVLKGTAICDGWGRFICANFICEGNFSNGLCHGMARITTSEATFEQLFNQGVATKGTNTWYEGPKKGRKYVGSYDGASILGTIYYANGNKYEGYCEDEMAHGVGVMTENGIGKKGMFKEDKLLKWL